MKTTVSVIVVVLLVGLGVWFAGNQQPAPAENTPSGVNTQGSVVFGITDAAADIKNVSEISMTVSKIEVHSTADAWVTLSGEAKTYNLLALNKSGEIILAGWANVAAGSYDQARIMVDKVTVTMTDGSTKTAKLPSGELKLMQDFMVTASTTSSVTLDFLGDRSLHLTGSGTYIFTPVVKSETRDNAEVEADAQGKLKIGGGSIRGNSNFGMDLNGEVKKDFEVKAGTKIELDAKGEIKLPAGLLKIESGTSGSATSSVKTGDVLNKIEDKLESGVNVGLGASARVVSLAVSGSNFTFSPSQLKVKMGDKVRVTFTNSGGTHDWKLDEFGVATKVLQGSASETVEFVANKKGTFEYYCSVGEHRAMGMKGNLIVE